MQATDSHHVMQGQGSTDEEMTRNSHAITEQEIAALMRRRIESGQLDPADIAVRLARYGLMDPVEFANEMRERLELEQAELTGSDPDAEADFEPPSRGNG